MTVLLFLSLAIAGAATPEPNPVAGDAQAGQQQASVADASVTPQVTSQTPEPARERQICRRQARIGTLAGYESICHTEAEWRAMAAGTQASYRQLQGTHGATNDRMGSENLLQRPH